MNELQIPVQARRRWYYWLSQVIVGVLFRIYFRHETSGIENLPEKKGAVIATNHTSVLDPPMIGVDLPRPVYYMAKKSLHDIPLFGSLIRAYNAFPVNRGGSSRAALDKAKEIVEKGNLLLIFPEGSRSGDGKIRKFKPGIGKIVLETGVPVIPGFIAGANDAWPEKGWWPRPRKTAVLFGPAVDFQNAVLSDNRRKNYQKVADDIQNAVMVLAASQGK